VALRLSSYRYEQPSESIRKPSSHYMLKELIELTRKRSFIKDPEILMTEEYMCTE
jgi:hypothetical protein